MSSFLIVPMLDHFSRSELAYTTTGEVRLASGFGEALEQHRIKFDAPIYLTSACRSPSHNVMVRGHPRSLHLVVNSHWGTGGSCAVGIASTDGQYRTKLIPLALDLEWSVSVASNFIHLDQRIRYCKLPQVVYHYVPRPMSICPEWRLRAPASHTSLKWAN